MPQCSENVERAASYDGHYFAARFASGNCKSLCCCDPDCGVLKDEKCGQKLRARPVMEAVGPQCFALSDTLGREIYPVGKSAAAAGVPAIFRMGMALVG